MGIECFGFHGVIIREKKYPASLALFKSFGLGTMEPLNHEMES